MPVWAKVVDSFSECREFFYKDTEPQGMDQNAMKICQQFEFGGSFYASLYSTFHRIPLYSAFTYDNTCTHSGGERSSQWKIEPQLSGMSSDKMELEAGYNRDTLKDKQAVNEDYGYTGYDRGHLNPNSFQCEDGRDATFTLTNSAPMDACFNQVHWKHWEEAVKLILKKEDSPGTAYIVTGTVPSKHYRIPRQGEFDPPNSRDFYRVTVPTHIWSAVCFTSDVDDEKSFSFGYIGLNQPDSKIHVKTVPQLNHELSQLYHSNVQVFVDDCYSSKPKSEKVIQSLYRRIQLPISDKLTMSEETLNLFHTAVTLFDDKQTAVKRPRLTSATIEGVFSSAEAWFESTETMKYVSMSTCVQSQPYTGPVSSHTELKNRELPDGSQELVCSLIPEVEEGCTSSCLYKEEVLGYRCYLHSSELSCSPQYSIITVSGTKCRSDHTCGTHGYRYYWCYTDSSWDYCSPPLPIGKGVGTKKGNGKHCRSNHNCGWYGAKYTWCYTDYNNHWDHCCSVDDRFSALNGRTCKSDHPCDYYGENYLWCWTKDDTWDYCCTQ
ncbi:uncharacterized protein LOC134444584 [Engraulis encrasicolus]|uniref:uncharacterized protein LOC134444584 n=1 Tax=Engraulis encrasicolus TaxID=184585 RepID=UPI002FD3C5DE